MPKVLTPEKEWAYDEMKREFLAGSGNWHEVTEAFYYQALEVVPPIYVPRGFMVGEPECDSSEGTVYASFTAVAGRFFARYSTKKTWLSDYQVLRSMLRLGALEPATVHRLEVLEAKHA